MMDALRNDTDSKADIWQPSNDTGQFGHPYFRFTILFGVTIVIITTLPLWLSIFIPYYIHYLNTGFIAWFTLVWIAIAYNASNNFSKLGTMPIPSIEALTVSRKRKFTHCVIVPCYLDPIDILFDCLGSLLLQQDPMTLFVVVTFEAKTPNVVTKEDSVRKAFGGRFGHFIIVVHHVDRNTEIAGGCSNKNFALREMTSYLNAQEHCFQGHAITVTTCDTDSLFHPCYFSTLEACYNNENQSVFGPPKMCVWQSPLFYNWDLDQRPFFNRITAIMRSMMMLGGLISFNLNPMSVFSYPIELGLQAGFINPRYGVDDIIAKVRWMCCTDEAVPVLLLPIPSISGPTIGATWLLEVEEWSRQIRRWIIGSSESFHYFLIHFKGRPLLSGMWWFIMFFNYYAILLCSAGIFTFLAGIPWPWVEESPGVQLGSLKLSLANVPLISLILQYLVFGVGFIIDRLAIKLMTVKDDISLSRNVMHWILAPPTLLVYSGVALYAIVGFIFQGKKMARHDMAAKEGLAAATTGAVAGVGNAALTPLLSVGDNYLSVSKDEEGDENDRRSEISLRKHSSRSTSVTREVLAGADTTTFAQQLEKGICSLPERFYFGKFSEAVSNIPVKIEL